MLVKHVDMTPFTAIEIEKLDSFIDKYDSFNRSVSSLEERVQTLLLEQKAVLDEWKATRAEEGLFFQDVADRSQIPVKLLKEMAMQYAQARKLISPSE